jgi:hypothetical protein
LLGLYPPHLLGCIVEWFADVGFGIREGIGHLARRLVAEVTDTAAAPVEHPVLTSLKFLMSAAPLGLPRLLGGYLAEPLVPQSDHALDQTTADQYGFTSHP